MFDMSKVCEYACDRYYQVVYSLGQYDVEQSVHGLLLNYYSGNVVLLSEKGIYHIKYKDIVFMRPVEPLTNKLSREFNELLESFREDNIS